jgi:hypothetical protein
MYETDISVKREVLSITRISETKVTVSVYYEFFNPKSAKEVEVGFEAASPSGDVHIQPVNGHHPYISQFTVAINEASVPFKVAIVSDSLYYKNGIYKSKTLAQALKETEDAEGTDFFYVYHFRAKFKQGLNTIRHTYTAELSSSIAEDYSYYYILSAAGRWANKQIDDFSLEINMGEYQNLCIPNTFYSTLTDWFIPIGAKTRVLKKDKGLGDATDSTEFYIRGGSLFYFKKNFKPTGELTIIAPSYRFYQGQRLYDAGIKDNFFSAKRSDPLPFSIDDLDAIMPPADEFSKRILKNLPYARRGYIFKSPELQAYFEKQSWYLKDEKPLTDIIVLTAKEQKWLKTL